jgi:hypothetical protein
MSGYSQGWGVQSSLIQRVSLDEIYDEIMDSERSRLTNKVAGIVVSGDLDGAQHNIGNLAISLLTLVLLFHLLVH